MATNDIITNAAINMAIAIQSNIATSPICVLGDSTPISAPTKKGVSVAESELSAPPVWISWLPLLPPPPSRLSIGLTTVLSIHTQKPHINAPSK